MKLKIYQIDLERDENGVAFESLDGLEKYQGDSAIDSSIYNSVFEGSMPSDSNLEDVYRVFNIDKPDGFNGRSLSVSDIVEVVESDAVQPGFYYCDSIGFKKVDFDPSMTQKAPETMITVVMVEPGKEAYVSSVGTKLEDLQAAVNGCIEAYYPFEEEVCIVCNDEGKFNGSSPCRAIYGEDGDMMDIIFGKFFVCDCSGENFGSLNEEQQKRYLEQYKLPERFYRVDGKIEALKFSPEPCREAR